MKRLNVIHGFLGIAVNLLAMQCLAAEKSAQLDWYQYMLLSTPVDGVVEQVYVNSGQRVKHKQRLLRLDQRGFRAEVNRAEAVLNRATETFTEAEREWERAQELFDRTAISVHDRELVRIEYSKANASKKEAQAELIRAKLELEYSEIRAPVAAIVVQVFAHQGQTVSNRLQAKPLLALAAATRMLARTMISAAELQDLKTGMQVDVSVQGQTLTGQIHRLGLEPVNNEQSPLYSLEVAFDPGDRTYRKGQPATIILP